MSGQAAMLLIRVRRRLCGLAVEHVVETLRPLPTDPVRGAPNFVQGVSLIRGIPLPVVDPGILLGCSEAAAPRRFVVLRTAQRRVALAVEGVLGVHAFTGKLQAELSPLLTDMTTELVALVASLDTELLLVLRASRVIPDAVWTQLGQGAA